MGFVSHRAEVMSSLNNAAKRGLEVCGSVAEGFAKDLCPVKTGRLRASITHKVLDERTAIIGTNVKYAPYVEMGTRRMAARPFLRPAAENHAALYKAIFERELSNA